MKFPSALVRYQTRVNRVLSRCFAKKIVLTSAMRETVLKGGKRIRPILVYVVGEALKVDLKTLDVIAASVELIHAYSLVHDDLPAMDNARLRHGKPACHIQFGEANAILMGDALQSLAFELLATQLPDTIVAENKLKIITCLAKAIGMAGMAGGQVLDLATEGKKLTFSELENIHYKKTGALIKACVEMVVLTKSFRRLTKRRILKGKESHKILERFTDCLGLAYQIQDDILDCQGSTKKLGKISHQDKINHKWTTVDALGLKKAKQKVEELFIEMDRVLACSQIEFKTLHKLINILRVRTK